MSKLHFKIATPERVVYDSEADQVTIPTTSGEITILPDHIPLVSIIAPGELRVTKGGDEQVMAITGGFLEIQKGSQITLLADTAERAEEIDVERAEAARKRAEEALQKQEFANDIEFASIQASLERSLARLRVARKKRH